MKQHWGSTRAMVCAGEKDICPRCLVLYHLGSLSSSSSSQLITFNTSRPRVLGPTHSSSQWPAASRTNTPRAGANLTTPRAGRPGLAPPAGAPTPLPGYLLLSWLLSLVWSAAALLLLSVPCPGLPEAACQSNCVSGLCPGH